MTFSFWKCLLGSKDKILVPPVLDMLVFYSHSNSASDYSFYCRVLTPKIQNYNFKQKIIRNKKIPAIKYSLGYVKWKSRRKKIALKANSLFFYLITLQCMDLL